MSWLHSCPVRRSNADYSSYGGGGVSEVGRSRSFTICEYGGGSSRCGCLSKKSSGTYDGIWSGSNGRRVPFGLPNGKAQGRSQNLARAL